MMSSRATDVVRGVSGYGLPSASAALPSEVLDHETWDTVLRAAFRRRVTGHLVHALDHEALPVSDGQRAAAFEAHERALVRDVMLERLLLTTVAEMNAANLATRVLRGLSVAHTVYPDPGLRSFGDIDVLVAQQDYDDAVAVLCNRGGGAYVSVDRSYARPAVAGLRALRGIRAKATYAVTLLLPSRAYVRAREGSYVRRAGRGLRLLRADRSQRRRQAFRT